MRAAISDVYGGAGEQRLQQRAPVRLSNQYRSPGVGFLFYMTSEVTRAVRSFFCDGWFPLEPQPALPDPGTGGTARLEPER